MSTAPPYRRISSPQTVSPEMKNVLTANWSTLEQAPPPTLREILGAYKSRGDGDREMLLAMLNAKSAEDQRLSSVASLQRSLLEIYQSPPPPPHLSTMHAADGGYYPPPPPPFSQSSYSIPRDYKSSLHRGESSRSSSHRVQYPSRDASSHSHLSAEPPRKRHRRSQSPPSPHSYRSSCEAPVSPASEMPPSPYSSSRSDLEEYPGRLTSGSRRESPPARAGMGIGLLVSSGGEQRTAPDHNGKRKGSPA